MCAACKECPNSPSGRGSIVRLPIHWQPCWWNGRQASSWRATRRSAMGLDGKAVLITGGSRGLGRALAFALGRRGAKLALVARDGAALAEAVDALRAEGAIAHGITADVADKNAVYAIAGQAAALVGPIDVLVHNASTLGPTPLRLLLDTDCEALEHVLQVNVVGPFRLTKALAGSMALRGSGLVLHVSSDAAVEAYPQWGAYGVSKAALDHL